MFYQREQQNSYRAYKPRTYTAAAQWQHKQANKLKPHAEDWNAAFWIELCWELSIYISFPGFCLKLTLWMSTSRSSQDVHLCAENMSSSWECFFNPKARSHFLSHTGKQNADKPPDKWVIFSFCSLILRYFFFPNASSPDGVPLLVCVCLCVCDRDNLWLEGLATCEKSNWIYGWGPSCDGRWRTFCCMLNGLSPPPWRFVLSVCVSGFKTTSEPIALSLCLIQTLSPFSLASRQSF